MTPQPPNMIFVKPEEGILIINPQTNVPLQPEGELVEDSLYYRRRVADGSAKIIDQTKPAKK